MATPAMTEAQDPQRLTHNTTGRWRTGCPCVSGDG
jgi:hypothetical protein